MTELDPAREYSTLELVSMVQEFNGLHEFLNDEDVDKALGAVVKLIARPDIPPHAAVRLIVQLQAISAKAGMTASYYTNVEKGNNQRKNVYYSLRDNLDKLVDSLKFIVKVNT